VDKGRDPHSVYGYDPETGEVHEPFDHRSPLECAGCHGMITPGREIWTTVTRARHAISVPAHPEHYEAARANTLEDTSWQRDQSHYGG